MFGPETCADPDGSAVEGKPGVLKLARKRVPLLCPSINGFVVNGLLLGVIPGNNAPGAG